MGFYPHFILPMRRSRGFASTATDFVALVRLGFPSAPRQRRLTWPGTVSRRIIMQKARDHPEGVAPFIGLSPLVGVWFQVHCPPLTGVLPTFRSRYSFAIGRQRVLSLTGWTPWIRTHFHVLSLTQVPARSLSLSLTGLSPAVARLSRTVQLGTRVLNAGPTTPPRLVRTV
jgi:hypothetical protein